MHYDPALGNHNLAHDPFLALVVPRPIGWISTVDRAGTVNLAPYSFFNAISSKPPFVLFSSYSLKDSQRNAEQTGEFVVNMATYDLREEVNATSAPVAPEIDEAAMMGLEMMPSIAVTTPRVKRAPVALECRYAKTVSLTDRAGQPCRAAIVIGEVVGIYVDDAVIVDGRVDIRALNPISRLGYTDYGTIGTVFSLPRPG